MKYILMLLISGSLLASCGSTDQNKSAVKGVHTDALTDSANFTALQWIDSTYQDIGKVKKGQVAEVTWRLRNVGNKPLVIAQVSPGCGCTVADKPEEPIMPGEEGKIKAKFESSGQHEGEHRKYLSVLTNTAQSTTHQLTFRVEVTK